MARNTTMSTAFNPQFLKHIKSAAALRGIVFSEFVRLAARNLAEQTFREQGLAIPDLSQWHMKPGGDFSEARAAKGGNYHKRPKTDNASKTTPKVRKRRSGAAG